ncbi:MAG: HD-GYP domain-containing protein [Thermoanaerobaculales bacterium]
MRSESTGTVQSTCISKSAPLAGSTLDERLTSLGALTEALHLSSDMSSIFVGYEDGDFFLVRSVGDRRVAAQSLDAPRGSRFAVQSIEGGGREAARKTLLFFDEGLTLLDSRPLDTGDFDPRGREWYRSAIERHDRITTDFYVFFTTGEVGLSFARQLAGGGGVVGADLALSDLSAGLASTMALTKNSLQQFLAISTALSAERDYRRLLEMILREARTVSHADGGAILMTNEEESGLEISILENTVTGVHVGGTSEAEPPFEPIPFRDAGDADGRPDIDSHTARTAATIQIADLAADQRFDTSAVRDRFDDDGYETCSLLSVPLTDQKDEIVGLLQLVRARAASGEAAGFAPEVVSYIEALATDAAVALDLRRLLKAQRDLLESFIHVVAGAIDAKSPYTHGHCQRVPELARMLAEAAHAADDGPLRDFELTDDERYELHIASWLHDCGKVTTPEYVVDKSTKLETIYNRIHEIRTRFEVLWRDAEIGYLRVVADHGEDDLEAKRRLEKILEKIRDDYAFVAECNLGELYNLSITRGTLTAEERFKINEHIVQTINMLGRLPFPKELRRVPDWAGSHHEKLDGTGYPRQLGADHLSTPARIMAIADIFEALTATDRPYMRPKSLNTALRIMGSMRDSGHICPDLFALFLTSGAYLEYAEQYLQPQQLKEPVDIDVHLRS